MSGVFGTFQRDSRPVDRQLWDRLGRMTAHRGPDGTVVWSKGSILLGHNALHTTTESLHEELPYYCNASGLAITADARIDNRDELLRALGMEEQLIVPLSDSGIILAAYKKWGEESFRRLLGDFSFVIWDSSTNQMFCVRDCLGVKPFYYFLSDELLAFSSEIKTIVMLPGVSDVPNEGMVGEYLAATHVSKTETLFRDILRLEPGHYLTVNPEKVCIRRYWEPGFKHRLRYSTPHEYVEHFQEIFSEAVRCRLRSHLPASIELSGGLDSSSITGMAHTLKAADMVAAFSIYSLVYPGLACNEKRYIESVEKHLGVTANYIDAARSKIPDWQQQIRETCALPDPPNLSNSVALLKNVQQNNSRVLLTGIGGDEWFTGSDYTCLDLLLERNYAGIAAELIRYFRDNRKEAWRKLATNLVWPLLPFSARTAIIRRRRGQSLYPPWISPAFAKKIHLDERILQDFAEPHVANLARADLFRIFHSGYESMVLEGNDTQKAHYQIECRHPFLDRRIIEFALSLPNSQHQQHGVRKHLLRLSGKHYLPTLIRNRHSKAEFSQLYSQAYSSQSFAGVLHDSELYANGWITRQPLQDAYENNLNCFRKNPSGPCPDSLYIWFAFAISTWYKLLCSSEWSKDK